MVRIGSSTSSIGISTDMQIAMIFLKNSERIPKPLKFDMSSRLHKISKLDGKRKNMVDEAFQFLWSVSILLTGSKNQLHTKLMRFFCSLIEARQAQRRFLRESS